MEPKTQSDLELRLLLTYTNLSKAPAAMKDFKNKKAQRNPRGYTKVRDFVPRAVQNIKVTTVDFECQHVKHPLKNVFKYFRL